METIENGLRVYRLYAECKTGTNFKFYECVARELEGGLGHFVANYGRIGTNGQTKDYGRSYSYEQAKSSAEQQFQTKLDKGYVKTAPLQALASTMQEPEDLMEMRNYTPIELPIPAWNSGSYELDERLSDAAQKIIEKLNLVRSSRREYKRSGYTSEEKYQEALTGVLGQWITSCSRLVQGRQAAYFTVEVEQKARTLHLLMCEKFGPVDGYIYFSIR